MSMARTPQDEPGLIQQAQRGDLEAFNALVLTYQDRVYSLSYRIMSDWPARRIWPRMPF